MKSKAIDEYGTKRWRLPNYKYHREDGPAIEYSGGDKSWYLNGENYTKIKYNQKMRSIKLKLLLK
jgi:hypothetical protein